MTIGLFFGSFNPVHVGHLIIAETMASSSLVDQVWLVVSPQNPFKKQGSLAHEFDRLDMVRAAIANNDLLSATDIEFHMPRPSYTIDTLTYLTDKNPGHTFKLIIGSDNLTHFHKWKNSDLIRQNYGLIVYPRPGQKEEVKKQYADAAWVEAPLLDISATYIRKRVQAEASLRYLLPEEVISLIHSRKLYL